MGTTFIRASSLLIAAVVIALAQLVPTTSSTQGLQSVSAFDGRSDFKSGGQHQFEWSGWHAMSFGQAKGLRISFRKGDNSFAERGMVFVRIDNRSNSTANGEYSFVIVNNTNGAVSKARSDGFAIRPGSLAEESSMWFLAPGNNENPNEWERASIAIRDIRLTMLEHLEN